MYWVPEDLGRHPGKEIGTCSLAMMNILTSYASVCAASVLDNDRFVSRSCFKSASRLSNAS